MTEREYLTPLEKGLTILMSGSIAWVMFASLVFGARFIIWVAPILEAFWKRVLGA